MSAIVTDLTAIQTFLAAIRPSASYKQTPPLRPVSDTFVLRLLDDRRTDDTSAQVLVSRDYQIAYFHATVSDALTVMDSVARACMDSVRIPVAGDRYIRVRDFNYAAPVQTENDLFLVIGAMQTEVRDLITQPTSPLIGEINIRYDTRED